MIWRHVHSVVLSLLLFAQLHLFLLPPPGLITGVQEPPVGVLGMSASAAGLARLQHLQRKQGTLDAATLKLQVRGCLTV